MRTLTKRSFPSALFRRRAGHGTTKQYLDEQTIIGILAARARG